MYLLKVGKLLTMNYMLPKSIQAYLGTPQLEIVES